MANSEFLRSSRTSLIGWNFVLLTLLFFCKFLFSTVLFPTSLNVGEKFLHSEKTISQAFFQMPSETGTHNLIFEQIVKPEDNSPVKDPVGECHQGVSLPFLLYASPDKISTFLSNSFPSTRHKVPLFILYHSWKTFLF